MSYRKPLSSSSPQSPLHRPEHAEARVVEARDVADVFEPSGGSDPAESPSDSEPHPSATRNLLYPDAAHRSRNMSLASTHCCARSSEMPIWGHLGLKCTILSGGSKSPRKSGRNYKHMSRRTQLSINSSVSYTTPRLASSTCLLPLAPTNMWIGPEYKTTLGTEQMKTIAWPIVKTHQIDSTLHIPDIVTKIFFMYGEYEVGIIDVGSTESWSHLGGRMHKYRLISSSIDKPLTWPVFVGVVKMYEHTKFKQPKLIRKADDYGEVVKKWKDLLLTALRESSGNMVTPEGGEVEDAEPPPRGSKYVLTHPITANDHVWCGELSAWFVLFDVSRYLSPEEREELDEGLISGKSIEEWEKLGYAIPMLKKYDDYLQDLYNLFCLRWRRVFARARFEVWKHGFEDLQLYKQECSESEFYETEKDIKKDHEFSRLGTELERQTNGEGLPSSFRLPFLDIVNAIRRGAMCCARERLETFQRGLPASGEVGLDHTTIGLSTFLASSGPQTDAEAKRR